MKQSGDQVADKLMFKKYGIGLREYDYLLIRQNGGCAICGRRPTAKRLHIDHCHELVKQKIETQKQGGLWFARVPSENIEYVDTRKNTAVFGARQLLKEKSVRGLLCWPCNRGLQVWWDNAKNMRSAAEYLERHRSSDDFYSH